MCQKRKPCACVPFTTNVSMPHDDGNIMLNLHPQASQLKKTKSKEKGKIKGKRKRGSFSKSRSRTILEKFL